MEHNLYHKIVNYLISCPGQRSNLKKIAKILNFSLVEIEVELVKLNADGLIRIFDDGNIKLMQMQKAKGATLQGVIDFSPHGNAYVQVEGYEKDVFIAEGRTGTALQGDLVALRIIDTKKKTKVEGTIVGVIDRKRTEFPGIVQLHKNNAFILPKDSKIHIDFFCPNPQPIYKDGDKVIVAMRQWNNNDKNPTVEILYKLEGKNDVDIVMKSLLIDHGFSLEFSTEVLQEANVLTETITKEDIDARRDFRGITTFTIDPEDAKDFDDAISYNALDNGNVEVGVHIADVSHYVLPGSALEQEAQRRTTSVYLVDRVLPMLPERISNELCSLRPHEDKRTFSAVFELTKEGKVVNEWIGRTLIHSNHRFSYEEAQEVIENKIGEYATELTVLNDMAKKIRERRFKSGALTFDTAEVRFKLNAEGTPISVFTKDRKDAHLLIEDYMLLANQTVATTLHKKFKFGVYRNHDLPDEQKIGDLALIATKLGYTMHLDTPKKIAESLNNMTLQCKGKPEENLLQSLSLRCMAKAYYSTKNIGHYGLAFDYYSHFTSPIRRYPDVLTHRLLQLMIDNKKQPNADEIELRCKKSSVMERAAMECERASTKYFQALYMSDNVGQVFQGVVSGMSQRGLFIELQPSKCEGMITISDLTTDTDFTYDERFKVLTSTDGKHRFVIGNKVLVKIKSVNLLKSQIDLILEV